MSEDLSEYESKVDAVVYDLEEVLADENELMKTGAMDAVTKLMTRVLLVHIYKSELPPQVVENQVQKTVGHIAGCCSDLFFEMHKKTLFGLGAPEESKEDE